ncbi:MAG: Rpn family recombination-promoting nuclease/putative transposase [Candidatus Cardinium sp.]|nr:Rpn family recombination-promoting nuclease/putative transposase [Candidatus Cardinium sp.]
MEKVTPKVDLAFKKIFGVEENKDLLIALINATVAPEDQVVDVTLLNPYNPKNFRTDRLSILDVKAVSETGKRFNIEIQITDEADYDKRALYYWAKLYTDQLQVSQTYGTLNKAIGIHILNFTSITDSQKYHNVFHITEKESGMVYFSDLELHTIELVKFSNDPKETLDTLLQKIKSALDIWTAFLSRNDLLHTDNLPGPLASNSLKKALHVLETLNFTEEERMAYEDRLKWLRIEAGTIEKVRNEGIQIGQEQGIQIGQEKEKIAIAAAMLQKGYPLEEVLLLTDLSRTQVEPIA